ncbi:MAG: hypothetical protein EBR82_78615 [Caulobacteraceae bacterium]|nr:hypothetical protein [Caulobacteraceae bacterium]
MKNARTLIQDTMLLRTDGEFDELYLNGDIVGGNTPCVTAATDSMVEEATWVYIPLEDAVADIIDNRDHLSVDEWAALIRDAIERGIQKGREIRRKDGR